MNPLYLAILVGIPAAIVGLAMLYIVHNPFRYWCTVDYLCAKQRDLGWADNDTCILIIIERDYAQVKNREERAWTLNLTSGTRTPMRLEKAKELIASFTRVARE